MDLGKMLSELEKKVMDSSSTSPGSSSPGLETLLDDYLKRETESLNSRQTGLQETIQIKSKELQTAKETLLVISGALQGMQHVAAFLQQQKNQRLQKEQEEMHRLSRVPISPPSVSGDEEARSVAKGYVPIPGLRSAMPLVSVGEEEEEEGGGATESGSVDA